MTEITLKKPNRNRVTTIPNSLANATELSWSARGILLYLLSVPEERNVGVEEIAANATDDVESVELGIAELKESGYLDQREDGMFVIYTDPK
jgi:hypothetical protein